MELKAILNLEENFEKPLEWWANLGEKGQIIAVPSFVVPTGAEGVIASPSLKRYETGMVLSVRREKPNRIVLQLPLQAFYLGAIPDVGEQIAIYARPISLEFWKAKDWKEEAIKTASILSGHMARIGPDHEKSI